MIKRAVVLFAVFSFLALLFFAPFGFTWPCPSATLLHVPCPTCGMTRAARLVAHGDLAGATRMHPLWFIVLPLFGVIAVRELAGYVRRGTWGAAGEIRGIAWIGLGVAVLLVVVWVARFFGAFGGPVAV